MKSPLSMSIGSWKISVTMLAWGISAAIHGGLLTASYYATWQPGPISNPDINFAKGEQSSRVMVRLIPWPEHAIEEEFHDAFREESSTHDEKAIMVDQQEVETISSPQTLPSDMTLNSTLTKDAIPNHPTVHDLGELSVDEFLTTHEDSEKTLDASSVEKLHITQSQAQPMSEVIHSPPKQAEGVISAPKTKEQVNHSPKIEEVAPDNLVPKMTALSTASQESTPQSSGVDSGVETLNLPKPRYPSLSRRQGEQGLVWLLVEVLQDGSVGEIVVLQDAGFRRLAQAAIAAVRKGHFKPAMRNGHAVKDTVRIPFRFVLR